MSFGHHADTERDDAHPLLLVDRFGWTYAELMHVDDQGVPTYRNLESREREWQGHADEGADFELMGDEDLDDAELAAAFGVDDGDDALYAELLAADAIAFG